ncbi:ImmA/IrrE family metallo-endopeptidase [Chitinophaga sp. S165]|uniref:ImmA/IrrE family metallo-endopeptidase n=1 Tax=Chitinophaga sp. S165 TaxID=2135462 RepID=UPI000D71C26A|nr:ImmA/IrrE family metallo-endopeptidase [Chitinophaga sp. S165]PWV46446.1 Zn-dependent peptidase ImmA (M78 family) [Chitinophaga sp. S165]
MNKSESFQPMWASVPGDTILDILSSKKMSLHEFAKGMDSDVEYARELLHGFVEINRDVAQKLEKTVGGSANFWVNRENQYRESITRLRESEEKEWLKELPIKEMKKFNWIGETSDIVQSCLRYFNVPDVWAWRKKYGVVTSLTAFRKSEKISSNPASVATWIRQGEIQSEFIKCNDWDAQRFEKTLKALRALVKSNKPSEFLVKLKDECAKCGVAVIIAQTPTGCAVNGATKFLTEKKAMILLSFRHKSEDNFWFTFFHEAGHLLLHGEKLILENSPSTQESIEEKEANEFALDILIPKNLQVRLRTMPVNAREIKNFAKDADISLGIVVGQLHYLERMPYSAFKGYIRRYEWEEIFHN